MPPVVCLREVGKSYVMGETVVHALRCVSLSVRRGEMIAIMGASGSGKSTLLNILGTLDRPTHGCYELDGEAVEQLDDAALSSIRNRKIGFVFQQFNLLPQDTALHNVEMPLIYAGVSRRRRREQALRALARVGLGERTHHLPSQLSGGQQQRVSIARAIVSEPPLLLADEPTGALDSTTSREVMQLLGELHAEGMTIVLVTHDRSVAEHAERIIVVRDGAIVSDDARRTAVPPVVVEAALP
ncbi:MAG: transporter, ATP-binding protein [bacterium]|nr:transporter, ATP-binding protein [bacterium]